MYKVAISIPSYHRRDMLAKALKSMVLLQNFCQVFVHCYVQDEAKPYTNDEREFFPANTTFTYVPSQKGVNIGRIVRDAYDATVKQYPEADFYILSDDDVLVVNEHEEFEDNFILMLNTMKHHEIDIGSAKIGDEPYSTRRFPQDELHTPFKERFIIFRGENKTVMGPEIDDISVGEDLFIFIKGMIAGQKITLFTGLLDYWHLPHMNQQRELSTLEGGFTEHAKEVVGESGQVTEENKYKLVARATNSTVQDRFDDLFDWGVVNDVLNPVRPDVLEYIKLNYKIDAGGYTQRLVNFRLYKEKNIRALADAIQGDEYNDEAQYEQKVQNIHSDWIDFVKRNIAEPWLECGPGRGLLLHHGLRADAYIEPSNVMVKGLTHTLATMCLDSSRPYTVVHGVIECIPETLNHYGEFASVVFLNGFFQVRSDYEAFIEVNRALKIGGTFVFNIYPDDSQDIICGRVLGPNNYLRIAREFGFDVQEFRASEGLFALVKVKNFDFRDLRKLQIVSRSDGSFDVKNFLPHTRDSKYV